MRTVGKHPQLRRIRLKLLVESVLLVLFLVVYYDAFDGDKRPLWLNVAFVVAVLLYIVNDVVGFINILHLTRGTSILVSLKSLEGRLRKLKLLSLISSLVFGLSLIGLLSFGITLTGTKIAILSGMVIMLLATLVVSYRIWSMRIRKVSESIATFNE